MEQTEKRNEACKSIFQGGNEDDIKIRFTQKWIEYINHTEKNKSQNLLKS